MFTNGWGRVHRTPWSTVTGSFLAMAVGSAPVVFVAFSVFMPAISEEFNWSRAQLSIGPSAFTLMSAAAMPIVGRMIDRYGLHLVTMGGIALFCLTLASAALLPPSIILFVVLFGFLGAFGASLSPLPYAKATSGVFDRRRGLALGIAMSGYGVGAAVMPLLSARLIDALGWRNAYVSIAAIVFFVAMASVFVLIANPRVEPNEEPVASPESTEAVTSGTAREAIMRTSEFWMIAAAMMLIAIAINGVIPHFVVMATDRGLSSKVAVSLVSGLGAASIVGRLASGFLFDRHFAPHVAALVFSLPLVGMVVLAGDAPGPYLMVSAVTLGIGLGAEVDFMGYIVGRYFGMRFFGEIYGYLLALFAVGASIGPYVLGLSYDRTGSYETALWVTSMGVVCAIFMISRLGPYRFQPQAD
jgi:MFS family permease